MRCPRGGPRGPGPGCAATRGKGFHGVASVAGGPSTARGGGGAEGDVLPTAPGIKPGSCHVRFAGTGQRPHREPQGRGFECPLRQCEALGWMARMPRRPCRPSSRRSRTDSSPAARAGAGRSARGQGGRAGPHRTQDDSDVRGKTRMAQELGLEPYRPVGQGRGTQRPDCRRMPGGRAGPHGRSGREMSGTVRSAGLDGPSQGGRAGLIALRDEHWSVRVERRAWAWPVPPRPCRPQRGQGRGCPAGRLRKRSRPSVVSRYRTHPAIRPGGPCFTVRLPVAATPPTFARKHQSLSVWRRTLTSDVVSLNGHLGNASYGSGDWLA